MMRRLFAIALVSAGFACAVPTVGLSCPNCKEAVAAQNPAEAARLKNGYFYSILLMVGMPIALTSAGAFFVYRAVKSGSLPEL
jgi:hypothetical protein